MRLAKQHKPYVAIMGIALSALFVDTFLLGEGESGPAQAAAAPTAPTPAGAPAQADAALAQAAAPAPSGPRLAERLTALRDQGRIGSDAQLFANAGEWLNPPPPPPAPEAALVATSGGEAQPQGLPVLTSVLAAGERSLVIIDGKTLRIGDTIGDARLHAVDLTGATFERNGQLVRVAAPR